eukprot:TRINITY_DN5760_c0_g1_i8.p1 TRINITY_DN5760_c0_g1~~TRINITY_DN5760_c0_g1_i8.p1  ORF type:complete len:842 (+),score=273.15 TRINITY_DN5760_c0_g1_i8:2657-5182(+)
MSRKSYNRSSRFFDIFSKVPDRVPDPSLMKEMIDACDARNTDKIISHLEDGMPLTTIFGDGAAMTLLHYAAEQRNVKLLEYIFSRQDKKMDVNIRDKDDWTPLHCACASKDNPSMKDLYDTIAMLLDAGAFVNALSKNGNSPLHYLVRLSPSNEREIYAKVLQMVLRAKADVNCQSSSTGETPLHLAVTFRNTVAIKCLIDQGANPSIKAKRGQSAFEMMDLSGATDRDKANAESVMKILRSAGKLDSLPELIVSIPFFHIERGFKNISYQKELSNLNLLNRSLYKNFFFGKDPINVMGKESEKGVLLLSMRKEKEKSVILIRCNTDDTMIMGPRLPTSESLIIALRSLTNGAFTTSTAPNYSHAMVKAEMDMRITSIMVSVVCLVESQTETPNDDELTAFTDFLDFISDQFNEDNQLIRITFDVSAQSYQSAHKYTTLASVAIVFSESTTIDPSIFLNSSTHVVLSVQPVRGNDGKITNYRMNCGRKLFIETFDPKLPYPAVFPKDASFKRFLFTKVINGYFVSAPKRDIMNVRDRALNEVYNTKDKEEKIMNGIDIYRIIEEIGKGVTSHAYRAMHRLLQKEFCVKQIRRSDLANEKAFKTVDLELDRLKKLDHRNIIRVHEKIMTSDNIYFILDLCLGKSLTENVLSHGKYSEHSAAGVMLQILDALKYMHSQKIAHRDLKPDNILFADRFRKVVKLIDFGYSKDLDNEEMNQTMVGTPDFIAPEVIDGQVVDVYKADMWSAGCIAYFLLFGTGPFSDQPDMRTTFDAIREVQYTLEEDKLSPEAVDFLRKLLVANANQRYDAEQALGHPWIVQHGKESRKVGNVVSFVNPESYTYTL